MVIYFRGKKKQKKKSLFEAESAKVLTDKQGNEHKTAALLPERVNKMIVTMELEMIPLD